MLLRAAFFVSILVGPSPMLQAQVAPPVQDPALARDLVTRGVADQSIRDTVVQLMQSGKPADAALLHRMNTVDSLNLAWLKRVVARRGWPGRSMVGVEASHYAFLLVQHAVQDTAFQASVLDLMEKGVTGGEVDGLDVALLADRVAVQRGQPQRYGTQARMENRKIMFQPILDSVNVDARRARLGLVPLAVYARQLDSLYGGQGRP